MSSRHCILEPYGKWPYTFPMLQTTSIDLQYKGKSNNLGKTDEDRCDGLKGNSKSIYSSAPYLVLFIYKGVVSL